MAPRPGSWRARTRAAEQLDEIDVAIVLRIGWTLRRVRDPHVDALVLGDAGGVQRHPVERLVPERGVVHSRLPRVPDLGETVPVPAALGVEVLVPCPKTRQEVFQEGRRSPPVGAASVHLPDGRGVDRRLDDPGGPRLLGGVRGKVDLPEVGAWEVARPVGEDDVGQQSVPPLPGEQRAQLLLRSRPGSRRRTPSRCRRRPSSTGAGTAGATGTSRGRASWRREPPWPFRSTRHRAPGPSSAPVRARCRSSFPCLAGSASGQS